MKRALILQACASTLFCVLPDSGTMTNLIELKGHPQFLPYILPNCADTPPPAGQVYGAPRAATVPSSKLFQCIFNARRHTSRDATACTGCTVPHWTARAAPSPVSVSAPLPFSRYQLSILESGLPGPASLSQLHKNVLRSKHKASCFS